MSGVASVQSCCRLCLCDKTDTLVSVFGAAAEDRSLSQRILAFVAVQINASDKLSTMVCSPCVSQLNSWQKYKEDCEKNQNKLEQLLRASNVPGLHDMSIQIKEEPPDAHDEVEMVEMDENGFPPIKPERIDVPELVMEEDFDYPPPLTPYNQQSVDDEDSQTSQTSQESQNSSVTESLSSGMFECSMCDKSFSTSQNRRKHEKHMHGISNVAKKPSSVESTTSNDEMSQNSVESQSESEDVDVEKVPSDSEQQKIAFAAGLKLLQTNETPIAFEPLSKIEFSYIEKCKAMIKMYKTRVCACHNVSYGHLKGLLSHLRSSQIWFPVFTCYHCMITYTDRSSFTRHHLRFHKNNDEFKQGTFIEGLIKLSNLRKRSDLKTRLYQNFRCAKCRFIFSFHEEFINHVNEDHMPDTAVACSCKKTFSDVEEYKKHVYVSCLVDYYCDICSERLPTAEAFIKHAAELHDSSEGFSILQEDTVKRRRTMSSRSSAPPSPSLIVNTKRRSSFYKQAPVLEPELDMDDNEEEEELTCKVKNPASQWKRKPTKCLACKKVYSSYANMMRHYRTHNQLEQSNGASEESEPEEDKICYSCPDCGGMYNAEKWQKHLKEHHKAKACPDCERVFQFQTELDQHRTVHLNLKVYRDSKTKSYKSAAVNPNSEAGIIHICDRCDTTFATNAELQAHKVLHETMPQLSPNKEVKASEFECKDCDMVFNGYRQLWEHDRTNHPEKRTPQSKNFPKQCKYCDKLFYTGGSYSNHKTMHERSGTTVAESEPAPKTKAKQSIKNSDDDDDEAGESYHTCNKCFKVFASKCQLRNHAKSHTKSTAATNTASKAKANKKVWCDSCHVSCENAEALEKHRLEEHVVKKEAKSASKTVQPSSGLVFTCDVCVMTFSTKIALKRHKERHAQEIRILSKTQTVYCKFCKIPFETVPLLNKHMQMDHKNELEQTRVPSPKKKIVQFSCDICSKVFQTPTALYVHQGWHRRTNYGLTNKQGKISKTPAKNLPDEAAARSSFQCSTCDAELPNNTALQIHILEKHRNVDAIILTLRCNTCKMDFKTQEEYENHKRLHDFLEKQQQNVHLTAVPKTKAAKQPQTETNAKPKHNCPQCGTQFTRVDNLAVHLRTIHNIVSGEFKCTQCERVFDKQMSLTIHLKVHEKQKSLTGVKSEKVVPKAKITTSNSKTAAYCCSICNMGFDLPKDLRTHTINSHPF